LTLKTEARELYRLLNTGRKYIIPLLENLEELKMTAREVITGSRELATDL